MKKEFRKLIVLRVQIDWKHTYYAMKQYGLFYQIDSVMFKSISSLLLEQQYLTWIRCTDLVYQSSSDFVLDGRIVNIS